MLQVRCEEREGELEALRQEGEAHLERARADKASCRLG